MKLLDFNSLSINEPLVATIGFFDGVHTGHRFLIDQLKQLALNKSFQSAVITFPVHPRKVLHTDFRPALLCGYDEKIARLSETGVDCCISLDFTEQISEMSAEVFIRKVLKEQLNVNTLLIGYDHRFGHNREDGFDQYLKYGELVGMEIVLAKKLESPSHISSSEIRRCLAAGKIDLANSMLGYRYVISGRIVEGFKVGRTIGFPTANIKIWEDFKVIPAFGVYAVLVNIDECRYGGMLYIGRRPTMQNGDNISLEVNIFDFDEDLYGKSLSVEFIQFVRRDQKFPNVDILIKHINQDKKDVLSILSSL